MFFSVVWFWLVFAIFFYKKKNHAVESKVKGSTQNAIIHSIIIIGIIDTIIQIVG